MIQLLGPIVVNGAPPTVGASDRRLLALLAVTPATVVPTERIIEFQWGEDPPGNPTNAVQASVSRLRRVLGSETPITNTGSGYRLDVAEDGVDSVVFERLVDRARSAADPHHRLSLIDEALGLWRGDAVVDLPESSGVRVHLEEQLAATIDARAATLLEVGRPADAVEAMERQVADRPLREGAWALLIRALYATGRQGDALRAYRRAERVLRDQLGISPGPELQRVERQVLAQADDLRWSDGSAIVGHPTGGGNVPAARESLIGRDDDLAQVADHLQRSRVVTMTGPGGVGKTTLALESARRWPGPAWFVDLSTSSGGSEVVDRLVEVLGIDALASSAGSVEARIAGRLDTGATLLVLDNCEHLTGAAAGLVGTLLDRAPSLRVLTTSREPLAIRGEQVHRLSPLVLPPPTAPLEEIRSNPAIRLLERRVSANAGRPLDDAELPVAATICRVVDGMPLAIELAAGAVDILSLAEVAERLAERQHVPTVDRRDRPDRHRTMAATIEWSIERLDADARHALGALSVLQGGGGPEVARRLIGGDDEDAAAVLHRLVTKSLVNRDHSGRVELLDEVRHQAAQLLSDELAAEIRAHHAHWFANLARALRPHLDAGPKQAFALRTLDEDAANFRAAARWALDNDMAAALDVAAAMVWAIALRARQPETLRLIEEVADRAGDHDSPQLVVVLTGLALAGVTGDRRPAREAWRAAAMAERLGSERNAVLARAIDALWVSEGLDQAAAQIRLCIDQASGHDLWLQGVVDLVASNIVGPVDGLEAATSLAQRAVDRLGEAGDPWRRATALTTLATMHRLAGRYEAATDAYESVLSVAPELGLHYDAHLALSELANVALLQGDAETAQERADEALKRSEHLGFPMVHAHALNTLGRVRRAAGKAEEAAEAHRAAARIYRALDAPGGLAHTLDCLGRVASDLGRFDEAIEHHVAALVHTRHGDDPLADAFSMEGLARAMAETGHHDDARALLEAAVDLRHSLGAPLAVAESDDVEAARRRIGSPSSESGSRSSKRDADDVIQALFEATSGVSSNDR